jgi:CRISPR-associated protein Cas1
MVVYVKTQGSRIVKEGRHLLVKKGDATYHTLFTYKLRQLLLFGNIEITHSAMNQLMRYNIDTVFLTRYGRYLGRLAPPESKNVFLHKRQYQLLDDSVLGLRVVKAIITGKISNMATLLMRIKRSRNKPEAGIKARQIQNLMPQLATAENIDSARGYEGRAAPNRSREFCSFAALHLSDEQGLCGCSIKKVIISGLGIKITQLDYAVV